MMMFLFSLCPIWLWSWQQQVWDGIAYCQAANILLLADERCVVSCCLQCVYRLWYIILQCHYSIVLLSIRYFHFESIDVAMAFFAPFPHITTSPESFAVTPYGRFSQKSHTFAEAFQLMRWVHQKSIFYVKLIF